MFVREGRENLMCLQFNGEPSFCFTLIYFFVKHNINMMKTNTETALPATKEVSLQVNAQKNKKIFKILSRNSGKNLNIKKVNKCFEDVEKLK
jgi:hypothetical protein